MDKKDRLSYLLNQYAAGLAAQEEVAEMFELLKDAENDEVLQSLVMNERYRVEPETNLPQHKWDAMWNALQEQTAENKNTPVISFNWSRLAAAAVLLILVSTGIYFFWNNTKSNPLPAQHLSKANNNDIAPGGNKAVLTLANGATITLDSAQNGLLAQQGNTRIIKLDDGQLVCNTGKQADGELTYNTISTPRGGQYQMLLPDGSKVWLNASSSLRFPLFFLSNERRVELSGEAYFEVAHKTGANGKKIPFIVHVNTASSIKGMDVEVLGTHFNVMAYQDEQSIKTTLMEGKVNVHQDGITKSLVPGKQAVVDNITHAMKVTDANVALAAAWKDGMFRFKETGIKELMRQVQRWYDVEVEYRTSSNGQDYTGIVSRSQNVSAVLKMLEATGTVHFKIEKSKIIVLP